MSTDLLSQADRVFDGDAVRELGIKLDEQPDRIEQTCALGAPVILAGLAQGLADPREAGRLADALRDDPREAETPAAGGLAEYVRHGPFDAASQRGQNLLRIVFGDRLGRVLDLIADDSGARPTSVGPLMGLLASSLADLIRRSLRDRGLGVAAVREHLAGQREAIARRAPSGLAEALGPIDAGRPSPNVSPLRMEPEPEPAGSMARWAVPSALGVLVLLAAYAILPHGPDRFDLSDDRVEIPAIPRSAVEGRPLVETVSRMVSLALPGDLTVDVPAGSPLEAMVLALRDGAIVEARAYPMVDLTFDADDRLAVDSSPTISRLARIAEAHPGLKIRVDGRRPLQEASPDAGREQARLRAQAVRDALIEAGVAADRLSVDVVAPNLPAEHPAAVATADLPISITVIPE